MAQQGLVQPPAFPVAFALQIAKDKPEELTVEEYLPLLRQHIARGRRENALSSIHRHLDRSSYWRSEYERVKQAFDASEQERIDLKLEVDRLKAKEEASRPSRQVKKRKQGDEDVVQVPRSPKRLKYITSEQTPSLTAHNVDAGFSFAHLGEPGKNLMRGFYQANEMLKSREKTQSARLAAHLVHAANSVSQVLQEIAASDPKNREEYANFLKEVLTAVDRAMQSLLVGYARVCNVAHGNEVSGQIVYGYLQILEKAAVIMDDFAMVEVNRELQQASQPTARPSTSKGKAKQSAVSAVKQKENSPVRILSSFIATSIDWLDPKTESHKPLFEGLVYVLIEQKLAPCLYTLVFERPRGETIEEDIAAGATTDEIEDAARPSDITSDELKFKSAKLQAPYIIQLLTRLMRAAPAHFGASLNSNSKSSKPKTASKTTMSKDNLGILAKERLQKTLINCMFGSEGTEEEDPFLDCLKKPVFSGSLPAVPVVKEESVQEWFTQEVWRLLGWEILARDGGW